MNEEPGLPIAATDPKGNSGARLFHFGICTTLGYVALATVYATHEWAHMLALKPDGFATFIAGVFAPLAFLWLVLGFLQQGIELRQSSAALWLQGEELRNAVEQQKALVGLSREQLELERDARQHAEAEADRLKWPILVVHGGGYSSSGGNLDFPIDIQNLGADCREFKVTNLETATLIRTSGAFKRTDVHRINLAAHVNNLPTEVRFRIDYVTLDELHGSETHRLALKDWPPGQDFVKLSKLDMTRQTS